MFFGTAPEYNSDLQPIHAAFFLSNWFAVGHASSLGSMVLPARMWFSICRRYATGGRIKSMRVSIVEESMRVLIVEDEPYLAEAIRDGLRLAAIAADIAGDGDTALELLSIN